MRPSISFAHFGFDEQLMGAIRKLEYTQPTPIQCQVLFYANIVQDYQRELKEPHATAGICAGHRRF